MKKILNEWKEYLFEARKQYEMDVSFKTEPDAKIYGAIFDEIRAITGITIVKTTQRIGKDNLGNKIVNLNLKFLLEPGLGGDYMKYVKNQLRQITDDEGDRIIAVKITTIPRPIK
jgi:hypothetical protein